MALAGDLQDMPLTVARSGHCGGEGVKRRVKHRVHKAIVQRTLTVHRQVRIGILEHLRRRILFRDQEQLPALGAQAHGRPAGDRRHERRQDQRDDDRRQPEQEAQIQPCHPDRPHQPQQQLRAVAHKGFPPRRGVIITLRRIPYHLPAEEGADHEDGVEQHTDRRQQDREQDLQQQ